MTQAITYVGLDVHKEQTAVAVMGSAGDDAVEFCIASSRVRHLAKKLRAAAQDASRIVAAYEAGPCGFVMRRALRAEGIECKVVAPSLIPVQPGQRIKTDRRDAKKLAQLLRARLLTEVTEPTPGEEAVRDLCRSREDARQDQQRARQRLATMLLRRGRVFRDGRHWTQRHRTWLRQQRFDEPADQIVFDDYLAAIEVAEERIRALETRIADIAAQPPYAAPVGWLRCLRGVDTLTALTLVSELYDIYRFPSPRPLMAYLGLVPSESSSGSSVRRGGITKTGNAHVRRVLVEAAWHARHQPAVGTKLRRRRQGQPAEIRDIADRAMRRLHRRWWHFVMLGRPTPEATSIVARELVGFVWAILTFGPQLHANSSS